MGRHEIRLRRNRMTSRRMERHKNYQDILRQHRQHRRGRIVKILLYMIALLALIFVIYFAMHRVSESKETEDTRPVTAQIISRPDIDFSLNKKEDGNKKTSATGHLS